MPGIVITPLDRLKKLHARLLANPEQHDQEEWIKRSECGTTACAAGWAILDAADDEPGVEVVYGSLIPGRVEVSRYVKLTPDGPARTVSTAARELLGLTVDQADHLFYGCTNDEAVEHIAHLIEERS